MAFIDSYDITQTSFRCIIDELDTSYANKQRVCDWYLGGYFMTTVTIPNGVARAGAVYFSGLVPGRTYSVRAEITYYLMDDTPQKVVLTTSVTTEGNPRPSDWNWQSNVSTGAVILISASEWNSFCQRINDFRQYAGLAEYSFTSAFSGDLISQRIVNEARAAIASIPGSGSLPFAAQTGDVITANFFNGLRSALNAVP